jgi:hypothetical protein
LGRSRRRTRRCARSQIEDEFFGKGIVDALNRQAFAALRASPGARTYYDQLRARGVGYHAALRQLGNRLVGILHGCLTSGTVYDEATAWGHHQQDLQAAA